MAISSSVSLSELAWREETPTLEFKREYPLAGPLTNEQKGELVKDIVALANSAARYGAPSAHLVIGRSDVAAYTWQDGGEVDLKMVCEVVNDKCEPRPDLVVHVVKVEGANLSVVEVFAPPAPIQLIKEIQDKKQRHKRGTVFLRFNESIGVAGPSDIDAIRVGIGRRAGHQPTATQLGELLETETKYVCSHPLARIRSLGEQFVPRMLREEEHDREVTREFDLHELVRKEPAVVIVGEPGSGKSLALLCAVFDHCCRAEAALKSGKAIDCEPAFYVHAFHLAQACARDDIGQAVAELIRLRNPHLDGRILDWVTDRVRRGRALLAIDGLDELEGRKIGGQPASGLLAERLQGVLRPPHALRIVLAARALDLSTLPVLEPSRWRLLPFRPGDFARAAASHLDPEVAVRFARSVTRSPELHNLLGSPLIFRLACQVWPSPGAASGQALSRRCELFDKIVQGFLTVWRDRATARNDPPSPEARASFRSFLCEFAFALWHSGIHGSVHGAKAAQVANGCPSHDSHRSSALRDLTDSGVLAIDEGEPPEYYFPHRTFQEFLVAEQLAVKYTTPSERPVAEQIIDECLKDEANHAVLWMIAGSKVAPADYLAGITARTARESEAGPDVETLPPPVVARLLADCLVESKHVESSAAVLEQAWSAIVRGLDRQQRQRRRREWTTAPDWDVLQRALSAVARHDRRAGAADVLELIATIRRRQVDKRPNGVLARDAVPSAEAWIDAGLRSTCSVVRWASLWALGHLHMAGWRTVSAERSAGVVEIVEGDPSPYVAALAIRLLAEIAPVATPPIARRMLATHAHAGGASAAIALARSAPGEATWQVLRNKWLEFARRGSEASDRRPLALVGALDDLLNSCKDDRVIAGWAADGTLVEALVNALESPQPLLGGSAASALGKLGVVDAWEALAALIARPVATSIEATRRNSAAFACSRLAETIARPRFGDVERMAVAALRDHASPPNLLKPAAFTLRRLAERGYATAGARDALLDVLDHRDPEVVKSCFRALITMPASLVAARFAERFHDLRDASLVARLLVDEVEDNVIWIVIELLPRAYRVDAAWIMRELAAVADGRTRQRWLAGSDCTEELSQLSQELADDSLEDREVAQAAAYLKRALKRRRGGNR